MSQTTSSDTNLLDGVISRDNIPEIVEWLRTSTSLVDATQEQQRDLLGRLCRAKHEEGIRLFFERTQGQLPKELMGLNITKLSSGNLERAFLRLAALGMKLNQRLKDDETILHFIAGTIHSEPWPEHSENYPESCYAHAQYCECIDAILSSGVDINARNIRGDTVLFLNTNECEDVAKTNFLLQKGAWPDLGNKNGDTALHLVKHAGVARALLACERININVRNNLGEAPLHHAVLYWPKDVIRAFVDHGADLEARTISGQTPLAYAACVRTLWEWGFVRSRDQRPRLDDYDRLRVRLVLERHLEATRVLLRAGADPHAMIGVGRRQRLSKIIATDWRIAPRMKRLFTAELARRERKTKLSRTR